MTPLISVVMSTYNRSGMLSESIESILNQTFDDFEFIIINDNSTDSTKEVIQSYSDSRIKLFNNKQNCGCTFNYHNAQNIAKGKYIAHIDDDDISLLTRFEKQYDYMENNPDITLLGTYIETFGENKRPSWVFYTEPQKLDFMLNFYNPICHSSVIYRKSFVEKHAINYDISKKCSQDYDLYKQIVMNGGLLANLPDVLVKYRMHKIRLTDIKETQDVQIENAEKVKKELLLRFVDEEKLQEITNLIKDFPFNNYNSDNVLNAIEILANSMMSKAIDCENIKKDVLLDVKNNLFRF